jgi:uncharacterized protein (TIGR00303 family)
MIRIYTRSQQAESWLQRYRGIQPDFVCVLGFTDTGLLPGISAAGKTPEDRRFTAIADAEFLVNGVQSNPTYPLPPLTAGASPVLISRAVVENLGIPVHLLNAGLPQLPAVPIIDLKGKPARCLSSGQALDFVTIELVFQQGVYWGEQLSQHAQERYLVISECVVGGTTTALAVLLGLGFDAIGKVNSSHPICNHSQKLELVQQGLRKISSNNPFAIAAAVGDPMQIAVAGMLIAASRTGGVLLAGGTQMLAVYALARAIATTYSLPWNPDQVMVGTTRWVAEDSTGDTVGLAQALDQVPLMATQLDFAQSRYPQLQAYEQGFVKEGVGAGGLAIAAHLFQGWENETLLSAIERLLERKQNAEKGAI